MASAERAAERREKIRLGVPTGRPDPASLPWPRSAEDGTPLGVDLSTAWLDVRRLMRARWKPPAGVSFEDYFQEACCLIARKNRTRSAHDPRKSSLGHYVWMIVSNMGANMANQERRRAMTVSYESFNEDGRSESWVASVPAPDPDHVLADAFHDLRRLGAAGAVGPRALDYAARVLAGEDTGIRNRRADHDLRRAMQAEIVRGVESSP